MRIRTQASNEGFQGNNGTRIRQTIEVNPRSVKMGFSPIGAKCMLIIM
ncbi:hypothetical protein [Virgibacillus sp. L01]